MPLFAACYNQWPQRPSVNLQAVMALSLGSGSAQVQLRFRFRFLSVSNGALLTAVRQHLTCRLEAND